MDVERLQLLLHVDLLHKDQLNKEVDEVLHHLGSKEMRHFSVPFSCSEDSRWKRFRILRCATILVRCGGCALGYAPEGRSGGTLRGNPLGGVWRLSFLLAEGIRVMETSCVFAPHVLASVSALDRDLPSPPSLQRGLWDCALGIDRAVRCIANSFHFIRS